MTAISGPLWSQNVPFTLDFETGDLRGWTETGNAFDSQPTLGDNPTARHRGQPSHHQGRYWIGTYERYQGKRGQKPGDIQGDGPIGTLTSAPFTIPKGTLSFLIGGGKGPQTRVELLVAGESAEIRHGSLSSFGLNKSVLSASGQDSETMQRVAWNLDPFAGKTGEIRIVDGSSGSWGHINIDDLRFSSPQAGAPGKPVHPQVKIVPPVLTVTQGEKATFESRSAGDSRISRIRQTWTGPGNRRGEGNSFTIATDDLAPGKYPISLSVIDPRGHAESVTATLEVLSYEPKYRVALNPGSQSVEEGDRVQFRASLSPSNERAEYCFSFGDHRPCAWSRSSESDHPYPRRGQYQARVKVRLREKIVAESMPVTIQVKARQTVRSLRLTPDKTRVDVGDRVTFRAVINPTLDNVEYTFSFGDGETKESDVPKAEHSYRSEGTFRAFVTARVNGQMVAESAPQSVAVERVPEMPVARIEPERTAVTQGETARFESRSTPEGQIKELWRGPGGQAAQGSRFDVETKGLDPRRYKIVLVVTDGRGQYARSVAVLEVTAPSSGRTQPPSLSLSWKPAKPKEGEKVIFTVVSGLSDNRLEYLVLFGDGEVKEWSASTEIEHVYGKSGVYSATVSARIGDRIVAESSPLNVTVGKKLIVIPEFIAALLIVAGFYVASKIMKRRRGKRFSKSSLTIRPVLDSGDQKMEDGYDLPSLPAIHLRPEADPGEQKIESSGEIAADERREHG